MAQSLRASACTTSSEITPVVRRIAASRKDGGLAAIQRRAFSAILAAAPEGGFVDLALASTAEKGAELSLYFAVQAPFHLSEAFPADMPIATTRWQGPRGS